MFIRKGIEAFRQLKTVLFTLIFTLLLASLSGCAPSTYQAPQYVVVSKSCCADGVWAERKYVSWVGPPVYQNATWEPGHANLAGDWVPGHYRYGY